MAIIKTQRNYVYALDPQDSDCMVETQIGPGAGGGNTYRRLLVQPISEYQAAVDWAVSMADQFEHPIRLVPISAAEFADEHRDAFQQCFDAMSPAERFELRREVVATAAAVMRDCENGEIRADAYEVLVKMGVVKR